MLRRNLKNVKKRMRDLRRRLKEKLTLWAQQGHVTRQGVDPDHLQVLSQTERALLPIISLNTIFGEKAHGDTDDCHSAAPASPSEDKPEDHTYTDPEVFPPAQHQEEEEERLPPLQSGLEEDLDHLLPLEAPAVGVGEESASDVGGSSGTPNLHEMPSPPPELPEHPPTLDAAGSAPPSTWTQPPSHAWGKAGVQHGEIMGAKEAF